MRPAIAALLAVVILSNVAGNFILTLGMRSAPPEAGPVTALLHPLVIGGIALLICWTLLRMKLLGMADLSYVLPITAVGYVLNAVAGAVLLHEQVSPQRWAGTLLIVAGAALTARTSAITEDPA
ncbi:MAG: EamA family transporter [Bryobacteraceae bacterium]|jgi:drug/metabolite transporter (DMT)-like permease|nr:EamA family transporter [Bryobacteraceae bacterium]